MHPYYTLLFCNLSIYYRFTRDTPIATDLTFAVMSLQPHGLRRRGPIERDHGTPSPNRERPSTNDVRRYRKYACACVHDHLIRSSHKSYEIQEVRLLGKRIVREDPSLTP